MFSKIDLSQVWLLTRFTLKSEWRTTSLRATGRKRKFSPWWAFFSILSYLILGAILTVFFAHNYDGDAYVTAASLLMLYIAAITASNIFMSFGTGFLSPDEAQIVAPLPITSETFFFSRLTVLLSYSTIISFLVTLGPAIALLALGQGVITSLGVLIAATLSSITASMAVVVMYGLILSKLPRVQLTKITSYVQFAGSLITTGSFIILPRMNRVDLHPYTISSHSYINAIPAFWFGSIAGVFHGVTSGFGLAGLALVLLALFSALSHVLLAKNYQQDVTDITASSVILTKQSKLKREPALLRMFVRMLGTHEARAVLMLFRAQFRYDPKFRMSLTASVPITVIYFVVAIVSGGVMDPFVQGLHGAVNSQGLYMVALFMPLLLMQSISQSENFKASWIFYSAPLDRAKLLLAVRNTLIAWVIVPFLIILAVLFSFFMPITHALPHVLVLGAFATLFFQASLFFAPKMPFAQRRKPNKGNVAVMFGVAICGGLGMLLLGLVMKFGYPHATTYLASLALIITTSVLLEFGVRARIRAKLDKEEFDG